MDYKMEKIGDKKCFITKQQYISDESRVERLLVLLIF